MKGRNRNCKSLINKIIICAILGIIIWFCIEEYKYIKINKTESNQPQYNTQNLYLQNEESENNTKEKEYPKEEIVAEYKGYTVVAKLEIPKIELETYVLQKYSVNALNVSVTKFWGANPNSVGNFCIAGHNFRNKNMFRNLKELEVGDKLFISDNQVGKVEYEVYRINIVEPEDVSCLSQETNGKKETTLITCTNNSKKRVIVKAKETEERG